MAKLILLLVGFVLIQASLALRCKKCKDHPKCEELEDETCPVQGSNKMAACLYHTYIDTNKVEVVEKKCVMFDKDKKYECDTTNKEDSICKPCFRDFCNEKSSSLRLRSGAMLLAVVLMLANRF